MKRALQVIFAFKNDIGDLRRYPKLAVSRLVEQTLDLMGDFLNLHQLEETRETFDRMKAAEDGMKRFFVAGIPLDIHQFVLDRGQVLGRFQNDVVQQFRIACDGIEAQAGRRRRLIWPFCFRLHRPLEVGNSGRKRLVETQQIRRSVRGRPGNRSGE